MSDVYSYLWLIPTLPFLAAVIITFLGPRYLRDLSHWPCLLAVGASAVLAFNVLLAVNAANAPTETSQNYYTFLHVGPEKHAEDTPTVDVEFSLRADAL